MRLLLHVSDARAAREGLRLAVFAGLATAPTLRPAATRASYAAVVMELASLAEGPLLAHVPYADLEFVREQATAWTSVATNVVPAIPVSDVSLPLIASLTEDGAQVCGSGVCTVAQGLLAAHAGASYVSVPMAQADAGLDLIAVIDDLAQLYEFYNVPCQVVADGLAGADQLAAAAKAGSHLATLSFDVARRAAVHPGTATILLPTP